MAPVFDPKRRSIPSIMRELEHDRIRLRGEGDRFVARRKRFFTYVRDASRPSAYSAA